MKRILLAAFLATGCMAIASCNMEDVSSALDSTPKKTLLGDISGVWRASDGSLLTFNYKDSKFQMLIGDTFVPVTLGDIDNENDTINLKVVTNEGKNGIWTIHRIWDDNKDKTAFHLSLTLHDGTQDDLSFVRVVTTDDVNRITSLESAPKAAPTSSILSSVLGPHDTTDGTAETDQNATDTSSNVAWSADEAAQSAADEANQQLTTVQPDDAADTASQQDSQSTETQSDQSQQSGTAIDGTSAPGGEDNGSR